MKVLAYRIYNQLKANGYIEVFTKEGEFAVEYPVSRMSQFAAACTMLISGDTVLYQPELQRFFLEAAKSSYLLEAHPEIQGFFDKDQKALKEGEDDE